MAKKTTSANPQQTFVVADLLVGTIYRDALSGYLVLVRVVEVTETPEIDGRYVKRVVQRKVGWMWNPVFGAHKEMELHDHQLISAGSETDLMPDTRYQRGQYGV